MTALVLRLPLPPPLSACFKNARGPGRVKTARYRAWITEAMMAVRAELREPRCWPPFPIPVAVHADYQIGRPDKRRRDLDNMGKSLGDALTAAGILVDDSQIIDLRLRWAAVEGVVVTIRPAREPASNPVWLT